MQYNGRKFSHMKNLVLDISWQFYNIDINAAVILKLHNKKENVEMHGRSVNNTGASQQEGCWSESWLAAFCLAHSLKICIFRPIEDSRFLN